MPRSLYVLLVGAVLNTTAVASHAITEAHSPGDVREDGMIDWNLMPYLGTVTQPYVTPIAGQPTIHATVTKTSGSVFSYVRSGEAADEALTDYLPGTSLFWSLSSIQPTAVVITFDQPIAGFGAMIESTYPGAYVGHLSAFDVNNVILDTYEFTGTKGIRKDGSVPFVGAVGALNEIKAVKIDVMSQLAANSYDFWMSNPRIQVVPEPASYFHVLVGLFGMASSQCGGRPRRERRLLSHL